MFGAPGLSTIAGASSTSAYLHSHRRHYVGSNLLSPIVHERMGIFHKWVLDRIPGLFPQVLVEDEMWSCHRSAFNLISGHSVQRAYASGHMAVTHYISWAMLNSVAWPSKVYTKLLKSLILPKISCLVNTWCVTLSACDPGASTIALACNIDVL